ncbi:MAG: NUDIX domain-containing protein [bacterium]|nr:NUDIX domain-containing protein [bacterium]
MEENANTQEEMLEIWDWDTARPTGKAVSRSTAHLQGIAHEAVHLWIIRTSGDEPEILVQHRAPHKDMFPDCLDITVGGHVPFGLVENKLRKEAFEEVGISPDDDELSDLGFFRYEEIHGKIFHREFQHVYLQINNMPLDEYRFTDGEVIGIYAVPLKKLEELLKKETTFEIKGFNGKKLMEKTVSRKDFHPLLLSPIMGEYLDTLIRAIKELIDRGSVSVRMKV